MTHGLAIERAGSVVMIKLTCATEYAAIELYERLVNSSKAGNLKLELATAEPQRQKQPPGSVDSPARDVRANGEPLPPRDGAESAEG